MTATYRASRNRGRIDVEVTAELSEVVECNCSDLRAVGFSALVRYAGAGEADGEGSRPLVAQPDGRARVLFAAQGGGDPGSFDGKDLIR
jgi:hypothetical protein